MHPSDSSQQVALCSQDSENIRLWSQHMIVKIHHHDLGILLYSLLSYIEPRLRDAYSYKRGIVPTWWPHDITFKGKNHYTKDGKTRLYNYYPASNTVMNRNSCIDSSYDIQLTLRRVPSYPRNRCYKPSFQVQPRDQGHPASNTVHSTIRGVIPFQYSSKGRDYNRRGDYPKNANRLSNRAQAYTKVYGGIKTFRFRQKKR